RLRQEATDDDEEHDPTEPREAGRLDVGRAIPSRLLGRGHGLDRCMARAKRGSRPEALFGDCQVRTRGLPIPERMGTYKDYYAALGVSRDASQETIAKAYKKLARKHHPDLSKEPGAEDRFKELGAAYEVLKDPKKREL